MGYSHQSYNTSPVSDIIEILDEYKLEYKCLTLGNGKARMLITRNYVYLECVSIDTDCDGTNLIYSKRYDRNTLFRNPITWKYYILVEEKISESINTKDFNIHIGKPCFNFRDTGYCKFKSKCKYLH